MHLDLKLFATSAALSFQFKKGPPIGNLDPYAC